MRKSISAKNSVINMGNGRTDEIDPRFHLHHVSYKFNEKYWAKLQEYYRLPWYKRLFKSPPQEVEE